MKDLYEIVKENEIDLTEFINWQIEYGPTDNFRRFAELTAKQEDVFKYAAILYPKFILVEKQVVLKDHYDPENWNSWRERLDAKSTANIVNHIHIEDYIPNYQNGVNKLEDGFAELLVFFWTMAVKNQFPKKKILIDYNGDVIKIINK